MICNICPRRCRVERAAKRGFCGVGCLPVVAKACLHYWEEPCISGSRGSGTVFFSGCNLKCVFCQNYKISQENFGQEISIERLSDIFISLQQKAAHNINLVNPTHFVPAIREAVKIAREKGLQIPIVYNSNGYDSSEILELMDGIVDVYLPDLKYFSSEVSKKYSGALDYFETASAAIKEMYRQVGTARLDEEGMMQRGMIVRHLVLPMHTGDSISVLEWVRNNMPQDIYVSVMSQYTPYYNACLHPEIDRRLTRHEYEKVMSRFYKLDFNNGYMQERASAEEIYIPEFNLDGV